MSRACSLLAASDVADKSASLLSDAIKISVFVTVADRLGIRVDQIFFDKLKTYEQERLKIMAEKNPGVETDEAYKESMLHARDAVNGYPKGPSR